MKKIIFGLLALLSLNVNAQIVGSGGGKIKSAVSGSPNAATLTGVAPESAIPATIARKATTDSLKERTSHIIPFMSIESLQSGLAESAEVVQVVKNNRVFTYRYDPASTATEDTATVIISGSRHYIVDERVISPYLFQAYGDGIHDDTRAIQRAVDYCIYFAKGKEFNLTEGRFRTTNTIHAGYGVLYHGTPYTTFVFKGVGGGFGQQASKIIPDFRDRPVLAFTSTRQGRVEGVDFIGDTYTKSVVNARAGLLYPNNVLGQTIK